ncbi:MAG TPA: hypothetical protein DCK95_10650 [Anaerolineaceae bacterium]|uniref:Uncharacterized protein n=1 Tax=Anaerolinea thermophila TaxID=167964 RepID=A0A101FYZ4_9CHLR|nr:MAG: hypothetical protein XD73_0109 [Anaerolinea thermophila]HAF62767.1 hypothetical protein [Anaerolineaceae bacterium]
MKKKLLYQIWIPLIISMILIGWAFYFFMRSMSGEPTLLSQWSDISLIYLLLPIIGFSLILLVITFAAIYFINHIGIKAKTGLQTTQKITGQLKEKTSRSGIKIIHFFSGPAAWLKTFQGVNKDE